MSLLRELDPNHARRRLRDLLLTVTDGPVPHSFEPADLLRLSDRLTARRSIRRERGRYLPLLSAACSAHALVGDEEACVRLTEDGIRSSPSGADQAQFYYVRGYQHHHRRGESERALEALQAGLERTVWERRLKSKIALAMGIVELDGGRLGDAERSLRTVLDLRVGEFEAHAVLCLGLVKSAGGEIAEGKALIARSRDLFRRDGNVQGVVSADAGLGFAHLHEGANESARERYEAVVEARRRLLDLSRIGRDLNNLAVACQRVGDFASAGAALEEAARINAASNRRMLLSGNLHNLGLCYAELGATDLAVAAFEESIRHAYESAASTNEFHALVDALKLCVRTESLQGLVPQILPRCFAFVEEGSDAVSKRLLLEFVKLTPAIFARCRPGRRITRCWPPRLATREARSALRSRLGSDLNETLAQRFYERIGDGIAQRFVPSLADLKGFLLSFTGDLFVSGNYTREFGLTQLRAKGHLRVLAEKCVTERLGVRKGAKYALAFHRPTPQPSLAAIRSAAG
jgi:hypothetical protein